MSVKKKAFVSLVLCAMLIMFVFVSGVLDRQKVWTEMVWSGLFFSTNPSLDLNDGDSYCVMNGGPGFTLPAGKYRVKWMIEADGANRIEITTANGVRAVPGWIPISLENVTGEYEFELKETAEKVQLRIHFESGTKINVIDMRLYSPMYRDHAFTFAFLLLVVWILYVLYLGGWLTPKRRGKLLIAGFAVLIASAPALKDTICLGHDTTFHLVRLCNLADGLASGQLPVRIGGYSYNSYGAITSAFYPDLFMYTPALLLNMGASLQYAVNMFFIAVNAVSAMTMYIAAKRMFGDEDTALCSSVLYTLSIYRISDVFTRYAFGEMTAMVFLPLFILGLWEVVFGEKKNWMTLALSASAILMSHMLSTMICAYAALGVGVLFVVKIFREGRFVSILKACMAACSLCMFYLVPFVMYSLQGIGAQALARDVVNDAISPAQLFLLGAGELAVDPQDRTLSTFAIEIGFPLLLGALLVVYVIATRKKCGKHKRLALLLVVAGMFFAWMSTTLFPWGYMRILTLETSDYLQFPWRMLMMTSAFLCLAGGWGYMSFAENTKEKATVLVLALCVMAALPTISAETRNNQYIQFGETVSPNLAHLEYTIPGTRTEPTLDRNVYTSGNVMIENYVRDGLNITADVKAETNAQIALPVFGFDGYVAEIDGQEAQWVTGENNRLTVLLPAGAAGELRVCFAGKLLWRIADGISLLMAFALVWMQCKKGRRTQR